MLNNIEKEHTAMLNVHDGTIFTSPFTCKRRRAPVHVHDVVITRPRWRHSKGETAARCMYTVARVPLHATIAGSRCKRSQVTCNFLHRGHQIAPSWTLNTMCVECLTSFMLINKVSYLDTGHNVAANLVLDEVYIDRSLGTLVAWRNRRPGLGWPWKSNRWK